MTYLKHRHRTLQKWPLILTSTSQSLNAPQRTETERAFLASYAIIRFVHIIPVDEVLVHSQHGKCEIEVGLTLEVNPPLSGVLRISLSVLTNRVSDFADILLAFPEQTGIRAEIYRRHEEHEGHNEHGRIKYVCLFITLPEDPQVLVPRLVHDLFV